MCEQPHPMAVVPSLSSTSGLVWVKPASGMEKRKQQQLLSSSCPGICVCLTENGRRKKKKKRKWEKNWTSHTTDWQLSLLHSQNHLDAVQTPSLSVLQLYNQNLQILLTLLFLHLNSWLYGLVTSSCLTLVTRWTVACQAPLSIEVIQARILEWVAISFSSWLFIESKN